MRPSRSLRMLVVATVGILSVVYILPVYVMVVTSLKTPAEITQRQYLLPGGTLQFGNYATALRLVLPSLVNSTLVVVTVTALSVLVGGLGGYFLARFKWPITKVVFVLLAIALYLPYQAVLIPLVQIVAKTRLALTFAGLILSYLILNVPLASVLMATFFFSVPRELEESAQVDGASAAQVYRAVYLPLMTPALTAVATFALLLAWNEYLYQYLLLSSIRNTTVAVAIAQFFNSDEAPWNYMMAAAIIYSLPPIVIFYALRRYMAAGLTRGALKG